MEIVSIDNKLFEDIVKMSQQELKTFLRIILEQQFYSPHEIIETEDFIIAIGDIPIALVSHLDTVHKSPPVNIFWDREKNVIWSPEGIGADDRAGVYAVLHILQDGYRPHLIFTTDEEVGGIGASMLACCYECPFQQLNYIIEIDRRGYGEAVYYECNNKKFIKYINSFGFKTKKGIYSDIVELCPAWGVAGVNLSAGYYYEHTKVEFLCINFLLDTIYKVENMLEEETIPQFKFIPNKRKNKGEKKIWQQEVQ